MHHLRGRCRKIASSVIYVEKHALVVGVDFGYVITDLLANKIERRPRIEAQVNINALLEVMSEDVQHTARRLYIYDLALTKSYKNGELQNLDRIQGKANQADA